MRSSLSNRYQHNIFCAPDQYGTKIATLDLMEQVRLDFAGSSIYLPLATYQSTVNRHKRTSYQLLSENTVLARMSRHALDKIRIRNAHQWASLALVIKSNNLYFWYIVQQKAICLQVEIHNCFLGKLICSVGTLYFQVSAKCMTRVKVQRAIHMVRDKLDSH